MDDENPYAAPQAELDELDPALKDDPRIRRRDNILLVPVDAVAPRRCVSCNRPAPHPLKVTIRSPESETKRDYRWYAVAAVVLALLFLASACAGIELPFDLPPHAPAWIFPLVIWGIFAASMVAQQRRNQTREFHTCFSHYCISWYSSVLSWVIIAFAVGIPVWTRLPNVDGDWLREFQSDYMLLFLAVVFASSWIPIWCHLNIHGKQLDAHTLEVQGFGKKYLESFPKFGDA